MMLPARPKKTGVTLPSGLIVSEQVAKEVTPSIRWTRDEFKVVRRAVKFLNSQDGRGLLDEFLQLNRDRVLFGLNPRSKPPAKSLEIPQGSE